MALQGTIDTFPLTDVLNLLSASARSGRLLLEGDRGTAALWIEDGQVVGGGPRVSPSMAGASLVFEMLRFADGSFAFDAPPPSERPEIDVEPTLLADCVESAKGLHAEWLQLLEVVPSAEHRVRLAPSLPSGSVTIDADTWTFVVAVATADRPSVGALADSLGLDEYAMTVRVAELIGASLATLDPPDASGETTAASAPAAADLREPAGGVEEVRSVVAEDHRGLASSTPEPDRAPPAFPDRFPIDDLIGAGADEGVDAWSAGGSELDAIQFTEPAARRDHDQAPIVDTSWDELLDDALDAAEEGDGDASAVPDSTDEVMRQMSKLSPQAAEAIAAALNSGSHPDHDEGEGSGGSTSFLGSF